MHKVHQLKDGQNNQENIEDNKHYYFVIGVLIRDLLVFGMIFNNYIPIILQRKYRQRIIDSKDAVNGLQNVPEDVEDVVHLLEVFEL